MEMDPQERESEMDERTSGEKVRGMTKGEKEKLANDIFEVRNHREMQEMDRAEAMEAMEAREAMIMRKLREIYER
jgi:hypothetical protein